MAKDKKKDKKKKKDFVSFHVKWDIDCINWEWLLLPIVKHLFLGIL